MSTLQFIPVWVFFLLAGLVALGLSQTRTRRLPARRLVITNLALTAFTVVGVVQQWRDTPWLVLGLAAWAAAGGLVVWALGRGAAPVGASYNPADQRFTVPGSWTPLALFLAIFFTKFAVGFLTATSPDLLHSLNAAIGLSALYGLFSGLLNARAWRLLQLGNA